MIHLSMHSIDLILRILYSEYLLSKEGQGRIFRLAIKLCGHAKLIKKEHSFYFAMKVDGKFYRNIMLE